MSQTFQGKVSKDILSGVGITSLIFAISVYMPIIGFFCSLFIPLPVLFYRSKLGRKGGAIVLGATIMLMVLISGRLNMGILFFLEMMLMGFVLSELIEKNLSLEKTVGYACAAVLSAGLLSLIFYSNISQIGIIDMVSEYISKNIELTMALYRNMNVPEETITHISNSLDRISHILVRIIPALVISLTLFVIWITLLMAKPILRTGSLFYPDFGSLKQWRVPEFMVWVAIGCGIGLLLPDDMFKILGLNGLIVIMTIYFFGGIAIISFYFEKKRFPILIRIFLYSLIALQHMFLILVIGLGFFDMWADFRKLNEGER